MFQKNIKRKYTPIISKKGAANVKKEHTNKYLYVKDPFHTLIHIPWGRLIFFVCLSITVFWIFFAILFELGGDCVHGGEDISPRFLKSFFLSVQTGTGIGYGDLHASTLYASTIVTLEALGSIFFSTVVFGIVFAKFARPGTRSESIIFSDVAVISERNEDTCLMFRILNASKDMLVSPVITLFYVHNSRTLEGEQYMKFEKMELKNSAEPFLGLPWTVVHRIDKTSPLYGFTLEEVRQQEGEVLVILEALNSSTSKLFQSRYYYTGDDFKIGAKFEDIITIGDDMQYHVEESKFHDYVFPTTFSVRDSSVWSPHPI